MWGSNGWGYTGRPARGPPLDKPSSDGPLNGPLRPGNDRGFRIRSRTQPHRSHQHLQPPARGSLQECCIRSSSITWAHPSDAPAMYFRLPRARRWYESICAPSATARHRRRHGRLTRVRGRFSAGPNRWRRVLSEPALVRKSCGPVMSCHRLGRLPLHARPLPSDSSHQSSKFAPQLCHNRLDKPEFVRNWAGLDQASPGIDELGRIWPGLDHCCPISTESGPCPKWPKASTISRILPGIDRPHLCRQTRLHDHYLETLLAQSNSFSRRAGSIKKAVKRVFVKRGGLLTNPL